MHILNKGVAIATLAFAALAAGAVGPAFAQDGDMGPLTALAEGDYNPWQLAVTPEGYSMQNKSDPTSIRYVWSTSPEGAEGSRTLTAWVELVSTTEDSSAGILYAFEEQDDGSTFYYMFMLRPGNQVTLFRRDADGVEAVKSLETDAVVPGTNELSIFEDGDQIALLVNGEVVGLYSGDRGIGTGRIGIVAWGTGDYLMRGFADSSQPGGSVKGEPAGAPADEPPPNK